MKRLNMVVVKWLGKNYLLESSRISALMRCIMACLAMLENACLGNICWIFM